jgi:hypothetical protein
VVHRLKELDKPLDKLQLFFGRQMNVEGVDLVDAGSVVDVVLVLVDEERAAVRVEGVSAVLVVAVDLQVVVVL